MRRAMTCRDGVALLMDYAEGRLSPGRRGMVDTHVAGCPRCRGFVASYREAPRIIREATACAPPPAVSARLRRFVEGLPSHRPASERGRRH
jgi:anti-sigma factor RsiW